MGVVVTFRLTIAKKLKLKINTILYSFILCTLVYAAYNLFQKNTAREKVYFHVFDSLPEGKVVLTFYLQV